MKKFKVELSFECYSSFDERTALQIDEIVDVPQLESWLTRGFMERATECIDPRSFVTIINAVEDE